MTWEKSMRTIERNGENKLKQKLPTPVSWDNGIKTMLLFIYFFQYISLKSMNSLRHQNYKNENTEYWDKKPLVRKKP